MVRTKENLKNVFRNLLKPTEENFWDWLDSYWHKYDPVANSGKTLDEYIRDVVETAVQSATVGGVTVPKEGAALKFDAYPVALPCSQPLRLIVNGVETVYTGEEEKVVIFNTAESGGAATVHTVAFNAAGGSPTPAPQTVLHGTTAVQPYGSPTRVGYTFGGWLVGEVQEEGVTPDGGFYDFATPVEGDITLTACWEVSWYTVTFDAASGTATPAQTVPHGSAASQPPAPARADYTFTGWYSSGNLYNFATPVEGDITLTAGWELNRYTVTFNAAGGTAPPAQAVPHGSAAEEPAAPARTGYTFSGWCCGGLPYDFAAPVTRNITVTAQWTANTYTATFKNKLTDSGYLMQHSVTYGQLLGNTPTPSGSQVDKPFLGWYPGLGSKLYKGSSIYDIAGNATFTPEYGTSTTTGDDEPEVVTGYENEEITTTPGSV
jgi:uncharacterized repeat protein (TIGR02543 family)